MNYEDSKKNIEFSKNFVMPLEGYTALVCYENKTPDLFLLTDFEKEPVIKKYLIKQIPIAIIYYENNDELMLTYNDSLIKYQYSFVLQNITDINFKENLKERARQELASLIRHLRK